MPLLSPLAGLVPHKHPLRVYARDGPNGVIDSGSHRSLCDLPLRHRTKAVTLLSLCVVCLYDPLSTLRAPSAVDPPSSAPSPAPHVTLLPVAAHSPAEWLRQWGPSTLMSGTRLFLSLKPACTSHPTSGVPCPSQIAGHPW